MKLEPKEDHVAFAQYHAIRLQGAAHIGLKVQENQFSFIASETRTPQQLGLGRSPSGREKTFRGVKATGFTGCQWVVVPQGCAIVSRAAHSNPTDFGALAGCF